VNLGEVHASLLEDAPLPHHTGATTAPFRPIPALLLKPTHTIECLEAGADLILKTCHQSSGALTGIGGGAFAHGA
jgi:hypothetical protein